MKKLVIGIAIITLLSTVFAVGCGGSNGSTTPTRSSPVSLQHWREAKVQQMLGQLKSAETLSVKNDTGLGRVTQIRKQRIAEAILHLREAIRRPETAKEVCSIPNPDWTGSRMDYLQEAICR